MASLQHWNKLLVELLERTDENLKKLVDQCLADVFNPYKKTELFAELSKICSGFLREIIDEQHEIGQRAYKLETFRPYTLNESTLEKYRAAAFADLSEARRVARANIYLDGLELRLGRPTTGPEREIKVQKVTDAQIGLDQFAKEVDVMSGVRGYYTYAGSRFIDNICLSIQAELFVNCKSRIYTVLRERLGITGPGGRSRLPVYSLREKTLIHDGD